MIVAAAFNVVPYLALSSLLFAVGVAGVLVRRNPLVMFMCVELMLNAVNVAFVAIGRELGDLGGQIAVFFVLVVAAAEVVVGLGIIVSIYKTRRSTSVDNANLLNQ